MTDEANQSQQQDSLPPDQMVIENISLEAFERAVYSQNYEAAGNMLVLYLRRLKCGSEFIGYSTNLSIKQILYSRMCAAVIALLADQKFGLSHDGFQIMASEHAIMDLLFRASVFETSDHLLPQLAQNPTESDRMKLKIADGPQLMKYLMTHSLRSGFALNFENVFKRGPQETFSMWAGMMSPLLTVNKVAHERREAVLAMHRLFKNVLISDAIMPTLSDVYMYTSYATSANKHDAKRTIHDLFAKMMKSRNVPIPSAATLAARRAKSLGRDKPVMLVCIEWFTSLHAMFRCYAPVIRQLRERFHLVAMSRPSDIDELGKAEFDEWYSVAQDNINLREVVEKVNEIAPDIIYHPSLGMALWWVALASQRFAPITVMSLGHPASSRSPCMDYVLCDDGAIGDVSLFTEHIVTYPNLSARFVMRPDAVFPEMVTEDDPQTVHIAVPAMMCKLNAPFMAAMREISDKSAKPVQFHFFVNMMGLNLYQSSREIRDWLPTALIYERTNYNTYLDHLRKCHLHLSTFPFGGTNSVIDSMLLGIPVLTLEGNEPHARFDAMMIRQAGMDEYLIAQSREEFIEHSVRLVDDNKTRNGYRDDLRSTDLQAIFFGDPPEGKRNAVADAMWRIFTEHEGLQAIRAAGYETSVCAETAK